MKPLDPIPSGNPVIHVVLLRDYTLSEVQLSNWASEFLGKVLTVTGQDPEMHVQFEGNDSQDLLSGFARALLPFSITP